jgi:hypothetical protein
VSIVHPLADLDLVEPGAAEASYFGERRFESVAGAGDLTMRFAGWARSLQHYSDALEAAGLAIASLAEPVADCGGGRAHMEPWRRRPLFLWMKARRLRG